MSINFQNGVVLSTSDFATLALQSGSFGLHAPNKPAFSAYGANAANTGTVVSWSTREFDVLNNLSTTTNRFTASVAGVYYFKYHQLLNYFYRGEYRINIRLNGASQWGRSIFHKVTAPAHTTIQVEAKIPMAVNDYVDCYVESAYAALDPAAGWNHFQGYMI